MVITIGTLAFASCITYLALMPAKDKSKYAALDDDDQIVVRSRKSRWD